MLRVLLLLVPLVIVVYALVDSLVARTPDVRTLPKAAWVLVIIVLPVIGAMLWFAFGRPLKRSSDGDRARVVGPDDDPGFLATLRRRKPS